MVSKSPKPKPRSKPRPKRAPRSAVDKRPKNAPEPQAASQPPPAQPPAAPQAGSAPYDAPPPQPDDSSMHDSGQPISRREMRGVVPQGPPPNPSRRIDAPPPPGAVAIQAPPPVGHEDPQDVPEAWPWEPRVPVQVVPTSHTAQDALAGQPGPWEGRAIGRRDEYDDDDDVVDDGVVGDGAVDDSVVDDVVDDDVVEDGVPDNSAEPRAVAAEVDGAPVATELDIVPEVESISKPATEVEPGGVNAPYRRTGFVSKETETEGPSIWAAVSVDHDFLEAEVSAVAGAPVAGGPRAAASSVGTQVHREEPSVEEVDEDTIISRRHRVVWTLTGPGGVPIELTGDRILLGRRPSARPEYRGAQTVRIDDPTVSKTHALLRLREDRWFITDLGSTNGILFSTVMGTDVEATPGVETEAGDQFLLGDAEVHLARRDG